MATAKDPDVPVREVPVPDVPARGPDGPAFLLRTLIGQTLRRLRLDQGRTLREVAEAARVSMPYLSEVERGRKEASSEVLAAICRALGIRLSDLLESVRDDLLCLEPARHTPAHLRPPAPHVSAGSRKDMSPRAEALHLVDVLAGRHLRGVGDPLAGAESSVVAETLADAGVLAGAEGLGHVRQAWYPGPAVHDVRCQAVA